MHPVGESSIIATGTCPGCAGQWHQHRGGTVVYLHLGGCMLHEQHRHALQQAACQQRAPISWGGMSPRAPKRCLDCTRLVYDGNSRCEQHRVSGSVIQSTHRIIANHRH